ncbi:dTDP-glucose 4,6-dehydratase [Reichenbachiella ulvae]|uniref:dTDP-glucose 4,6-dehydratase n=1 Tax=Reichenbachiella ulvae TaxID=2980104 RepID=A0ABT3D0F1_9BACT|nr:dTDP-glucose 4,6-dehydratase [Reichenbachiella ulvae]MCV9389239.1 dTDP-glucose 4,6-dehydratase [Reichenbachiella ulvae]
MKKSILITGGAGFIGSHVVRYFSNQYTDYQIINLDKLTYAGNKENISDIVNSNYEFIQGDICDATFIDALFKDKQITDVIHLAAESHVDRSIEDPLAFVNTNVIGTVNLLNAAKSYWADDLDAHLFYHVSTDEVYGSLKDGEFFLETTSYDPQSPYSASKASSDHFVRAYANTYKLPIVVSNCSNNYGPNQFPEKLIPVCIQNILDEKPLPIYGEGVNVRDWLFVHDHVTAIDAIFHKGKRGDTYNIGGFNEWKNIDLVKTLCKVMDEKLGREKGHSEKLITFVKDRAGHDMRYAIDSTKISKELDWKPSVQFEEGLAKTVDWYLENGQWMENIRTGEYRK